MEKIRFFYDNLLDTATCTSSSVVTRYPIANLLHDWYSKYTRTTGVTTEWWKWDMAADKSVSGIIFKGHNFRVGSTVKIQANTEAIGDNWGSPSFDETIPITTALLAKELVYKFWETPQIFRWVRLTVADVGNPDGFLKLGRPWAGVCLEPSKNFDNEYVRGLEDLSIVSETSDGYHFATKVAKKLATLSYQFTDLTNVDRLALLAVFENVGYTDNYFLLQDADDAVNTLFYGRNLDKEWTFAHILCDDDFNFSFLFKESR